MRKMYLKRKIFAVVLLISLLSSALPVRISAERRELRVGSTITFGSYEQDGVTLNGSEPIEWYVLYTDNDTALLITKYALFPGAYNNSWGSLTWDECSLRDWLNDTFYEDVFSSTEKNAILTTALPGETNPVYKTSAGEETEDKVFILSIAEAKKYLNETRLLKGVPTDYAVACGTRKSEDGTCWYWLRNPGKTHTKAAYVTTDVTISELGAQLNYYDGGVRPVIRVATSKLS